VPRLRFEEEPFGERKFVCGLSQGEGSFTTSWHREKQKYYPVFSLGMTEPKPVEYAARFFGLTVYRAVTEEAEGRVMRYIISATATPAISIANYTIQYVLPESVRHKQAGRLLRLFRERVSLTEEEFKRVMEELG